ncbi:hypothetical protein DPEC_G00111040 [Dallia pectoralis]|uniref:Uncharacterized protein n=1 Tax=Dallia pectoralis TaxID=75939 RepID=A0ACC2GT35_DALPE|nr:hypothetical protein DPEC_G00111040 [Dallia pectoralis]
MGPVKTPDTSPWGEKHGEREGEEDRSLSSQRSSTDESDESDGSDPEPPPVIRRKVSFADAFGLDLVYVKEFDSADLTEAQGTIPTEPRANVSKEMDEYFLKSLFAVPSSPEELERRLQDQKLELESVELLSGTTALRVIVRVVNVCYSKSLYARITLDSWKTYFDLLAEYVPGSSDGTTDRFAFRLTLVPPFETGGARVEFCLRYETLFGTFWANNGGMNYVLFCHMRGGRDLTEMDTQTEEARNSREKRSCLKRNSKRNGADEKPNEAVTDPPDSATDIAEGVDGRTVETAEALTCPSHDGDHKPVSSQRSKRRTTRLALVQEYFSHRHQDSTQGHISKGPLPHDWEENSLTMSDTRINPIGGASRQKTQANDTPTLLTYHPIPQLFPDCGEDNEQAGNPDDDIRTNTGIPPESEAILGEQMSVSELWEAFLCAPVSKDKGRVSESKDAVMRCPAQMSPSPEKTKTWFMIPTKG